MNPDVKVLAERPLKLGCGDRLPPANEIKRGVP